MIVLCQQLLLLCERTPAWEDYEVTVKVKKLECHQLDAVFTRDLRLSSVYSVLPPEPGRPAFPSQHTFAHANRATDKRHRDVSLVHHKRAAAHNGLAVNCGEQ